MSIPKHWRLALQSTQSPTALFHLDWVSLGAFASVFVPLPAAFIDFSSFILSCFTEPCTLVPDIGLAFSVCVLEPCALNCMHGLYFPC